MTNPSIDKYARDGSSANDGHANLRWSQRLVGGAHALIRQIERLDAYAVRQFIDGLSSENKHQHFLLHIGRAGESFVTHLTHVDGINEVALVAVMKEGAAEKILALCYYRKEIAQSCATCTLMIADDWQNKGLGGALIRHLIEIARTDRLGTMRFIENAENLELRGLAHELGFHVHVNPDDTNQLIYTMDLTLPLHADTLAAS